jgi:hypothetical protein
VVRRSLLLALIAAAFGVSASAAPAYHTHGAAWPGGVVPYYNAAPDQAWAVAQAVAAWNRSGARVKFVAVPKAQAKLLISEPPASVYCTEGRASIGYYASGAFVHIFHGSGLTHACNRYWAARVMAHELGHVLGLEHEDRLCAAMNASGDLHGGAECEPKPLWDWRCRLLEQDDIAGAVAVYGGFIHVPSGSPLCPLYPAIRQPGLLKAHYDPATNQVSLSFTRPAEPSIPSFLIPVPWQTRDSFAVGSFPAASGRPCSPPSDSTSALHGRWQTRPGGTEQIATSLAAGETCFAVWSVDRLGRPSTRPSVVKLKVG